MKTFSEEKIFENPEINCLCDRLLYFQPENSNLVLGGSVAKILMKKIIERPVKDIDFLLTDDETYNYILDNGEEVLGFAPVVGEDRLSIATKYVNFEFFDVRSRRIEIFMYKDIKLDKNSKWA